MLYNVQFLFSQPLLLPEEVEGDGCRRAVVEVLADDEKGRVRLYDDGCMFVKAFVLSYRIGQVVSLRTSVRRRNDKDVSLIGKGKGEALVGVSAV